MKVLRTILDQLVPDKIRIRGNLYFLRGSVTNLSYTEQRATAIVLGTNRYNVEIEFDKTKFPHKTFCTCPYSGVCKHVVAVLYKLNEINFFKERESLMKNEYKYSYNTNNIALPSINPNENKINLVGKTREEWLQEIELKREAAKFDRFKDGITGLIDKEKIKNKSPNFSIGYSIQAKGYRTWLYVIRQKKKKDSDISTLEIMHDSNLSYLVDVSLEEKLIINHITRHLGEYHVDLFSENEYGTRKREHINEANIFDEILTFLTDKNVFLYSGYGTFDKRVYIQKEVGKAGLLFNEDGDNISLNLQFEFKDEIITSETIVPILDTPLWVMADDKIFKISNLSYRQFYNFYKNSNKIIVPKVYLEYFEQNLLPQLSQNLSIYSDKYIVEDVSLFPVKRIYLEEENKEMKITLKYAYGEHEVSYDENETTTSFFRGKKIFRIIRNKKAEEEARAEIKQFYVKEIQPGVFTPRGNPIHFLFDSLLSIKEMGFEIFGEASLTKFKVNTSTPSFSFSVSSGIDWFDVSTEISFNGTSIAFDALLDAIKHKREYVQLKDGSLGILPQKWLNKFKRAFSFGELVKNETAPDKPTIRFSKLQVNAIDLLLEDAEIKADEKYNEHLERLNSFKNIRQYNIPSSFKNVLRPYQSKGFDWLNFLKEYRFGGILADDMGLGKTIQVLSLLLNEKENGKEFPDLVVAPTSVVFNWISEAQKFAPSLKILNHTGTNRIKENTLHFEEYDVVITSYSIVLKDIQHFIERKFNYLILDESQKIKNPAAKTARLIKAIKSEYRLCLTGTPVENNLIELWSQMSFLNPGMLGSLNKFQETFVKSIQKNNDDSASEYLKKIVYPFILRRKKEVVAKELPEKTEVIQYCEMDSNQQRIYNIWKNSIREEILKEIETKGIKKSGIKVIEGLLRLRQICNHPLLVKENYKSKSGKFEEFKEQLENVLEEGHKVLVFSQFVGMLEIIKEYLIRQNIAFEYLTGNTKDREKCVNNFQENNNVKIFLISLKAGGFGLNLTAADYVFHYDPWWNPAVEAQATDRTHRIGQSKNVFVYKFITKDSVEEKILLLQNKKKKLVENIITSETGILKNLTKDDINILFE